MEKNVYPVIFNGVCSVKEAPNPVKIVVGYHNSSDTPKYLPVWPNG